MSTIPGLCLRVKRVRLLLVGWLLLTLSIILGQRAWQIYAAPVITVTKTALLLVDQNHNAQLDPGDTLRYTIIITNSGDMDTTGVHISDTLDPNTTLVPGSLQTTPLARHDSGYSTVGNVQLHVPVAQSLLNNDSDPDGTDGLTVSAFSDISTHGGNVSVAADGSFTYDPPPGFSGADTFSYTVDDGEDNHVTATVTITVGQVVWFINNADGGLGDGRFTAPFPTIANFNAQAADEPGDIIFIYQGVDSYRDALSLRNNQQLIGHGDGLLLAPNLLITATVRPTIANVSLATGNTVRGLNIDAVSGVGLNGDDVGALTVNNVAVTSSGANALTLRGGDELMDVTFDSVSASGGNHGISLTNNRGRVTVNGGTIQNTSGHAILLSNTTGPLDFSLKNSTIANAAAGQNGLHLEIPSSGSFGTVTVQNNTIADNGSIGVRVSVGGTGSIGKLEISDNTFTNNPSGVDLVTGGAAGVTFDIHDNLTLSGEQTQVYIAANDSLHNDGVGPTLTGHIRNNTITLNPTANGIALWVVSNGDGNIRVNIANNEITGFGDSGIDVESLGGMSNVQARIADNTVSTTATPSVAGIYLRNGDGSSGETSLLCVDLSSNTINGGTEAKADYYLERANQDATIFQIQDLSPTPATPDQVVSFIANTDAAPPATVGVAPGTYVAATCHPVGLMGTSFHGEGQVMSGFVPGGIAPKRPALSGAKGLGKPDRSVFKIFFAGMDFTLLRARIAAHTYRLVANFFALFQATPAHAGGETVTLDLDTLNVGRQIVITFDVTIDDDFVETEVCNQSTVSGNNFSAVASDDPTVVGNGVDSADPTCTTGAPPDTSAPDTVIDSTPSDPSNRLSASFTFSGTDNVTLPELLSFLCKLDNGAFVVCTSPQSYSDLADGLHAFQVRAVDGVGNVDPTPASFTWTINTAMTIPDLTITKQHTGIFILGQRDARYTIIVRNRGSAPTNGLVTVADDLPAGLTATALTGDGWTCTLSSLDCIRSDALAAGADYPPITLTVNVAPNASATLTNSVTVSGGNDANNANNTATDPTQATTGYALFLPVVTQSP